MRVALVTTEFVTEQVNHGGLGNYVNKMAQALRDQGHQPEVFVTSEAGPEVFEYEGITVHRVDRATSNQKLAFRAVWKLRIMSRSLGLAWPDDRLICELVHVASLAEAFHRRERVAPFDLVQGHGFGLFIRRRYDRPVLHRCSAAPDLLPAAAGDTSALRRFCTRLEFASMRRADLVYAPSRLIADHLTRVIGRPVGVIRPPMVLGHQPAAEPPRSLPNRYLIHFGLLVPYKGTAWLSEALPLAWEQEPELTMVWAGRAESESLAQYAATLGPLRDRVIYLGALPKPQLYAVLRGAEAAVLPSLHDNLPNTVIESLLFGVPVLGSAGASIEELVEPSVTGELVPLGDVQALANALVRIWRGQSPVRKGFHWQSPITQEMEPAQAVENLLNFAQSVRPRGRPLHAPHLRPPGMSGT